MKKIAIIGMGCLFPKAPNLSQYYQLLFEGKNAIQNISHQRWPAFYYQPSTQRVDRFYSNQAACVDEYSYFDALQFKTMPNVIHGTEPDQLLGLQVVSQALEDAGYWKRNFHREKTSVILGRGA
jgi:acyl transferase domain-containing protein